jgi:hypothetical protein
MCIASHMYLLRWHNLCIPALPFLLMPQIDIQVLLVRSHASRNQRKRIHPIHDLTLLRFTSGFAILSFYCSLADPDIA